MLRDSPRDVQSVKAHRQEKGIVFVDLLRNDFKRSASRRVPMTCAPMLTRSKEQLGRFQSSEAKKEGRNDATDRLP
jgi:hypothetical protein